MGWRKSVAGVLGALLLVSLHCPAGADDITSWEKLKETIRAGEGPGALTEASASLGKLSFKDMGRIDREMMEDLKARPAAESEAVQMTMMMLLTVYLGEKSMTVEEFVTEFGAGKTPHSTAWVLTAMYGMEKDLRIAKPEQMVKLYDIVKARVTDETGTVRLKGLALRMLVACSSLPSLKTKVRETADLLVGIIGRSEPSREMASAAIEEFEQVLAAVSGDPVLKGEVKKKLEATAEGTKDTGLKAAILKLAGRL